MAMRFRIPTSNSQLSNWVLRIKELSSHGVGKWQEVLSHYRELKRMGAELTERSLFPPILKACLLLSFRQGRSIHACLVKQGYDSFTSIANSIVDFYAKAGELDCALHVFDCMRNRDSVTWNIIILGHLDRGALEEGLWLFMQGRAAGFEPNTATLVLVIQACRSFRATNEGLKLHGYIIRSGFWAITSVLNSLLSMYADIKMELAWTLFDEMCERDVVSWSVMIRGYVQSGEDQVAFWLFQEMLSKYGSEIDAQTMASVLKACVNYCDINIGRLVHGIVIRMGFGTDLFVGNSLIDMYFKCNDTDSAFGAFNEMARRNVVSWNSLLSGLVSKEKHLEAIRIFASMGKEGAEADAVTLVNLLQTCKKFLDPYWCKSIRSAITRGGYELNELVMNSLIDAYAKCNLITFAEKLFNQMTKRDTVTWSTMIAGFTHCGMPDEAIAAFKEMSWVHEKPNAVTMINLLEACSAAAELKASKWAHGIAIRTGLAAEVAVGSAILDTYSKCGAIEASRKAFDEIPHKNIVAWSAMIAAYGMNGLSHDALALLSKMKAHGLKPNPVTAVSVLSACSHGGLVEEGLSFFEEAVQDHDVELGLEHYSCMVDLLSRAGKLDRAVDLIKSIPEGLKAGASAWGALLSACRSHGNIELGAGAVCNILELEPSNSAGYLLASSMYAAGGLWNEAARMRWLAKERGVRVVAGYSLVSVDNRARRFVAGAKSQPLCHEICLAVQRLHLCMKINQREVTVFEL